MSGPVYQYNVSRIPEGAGTGAVLHLYKNGAEVRQIAFPAEQGLFGPMIDEAVSKASQAGEECCHDYNKSLKDMKKILAE